MPTVRREKEMNHASFSQPSGNAANHGSVGVRRAVSRAVSPIRGKLFVEVTKRTTKLTLEQSWDKIYAVRGIPEDLFWICCRAIEREAISLHPTEADAISQIIDAYAYRARTIATETWLRPGTIHTSHHRGSL